MRCFAASPIATATRAKQAKVAGVVILLLGLTGAGCLAAQAESSAAAQTDSGEASSFDQEVQRFALDSKGRLVQFDQHVAPIFAKHCLQCHNAKEQRGGFQVDDRDTVLAYVVPEDAQASSLFADYLTSDDEDLLMPPRAQGGPLSATELSLIRVWIDEGADWPRGAAVSLSQDRDLAKPVTPPTSLVGRVWLAQGFLHPATVHFPIALFLVGAVFVVVGWKWPAWGTQIPLACLLIGALASIASTAMGFAFAVQQGYGSWNQFGAEMFDKEIFWHRWTGFLVSVIASVLAVVALRSIGQQRQAGQSRGTRIWKGGLLVVAALVGLAGHQGGELTYGPDLYPKMLRTLLGRPDGTRENQPPASQSSANLTPTSLNPTTLTSTPMGNTAGAAALDR